MNQAEKKQKRGKKIKYIVSLISVGIFIYSYFILYANYTIKTEETYKEIDKVKLEIMEREIMLEQEEEVLISLDEVNAKKQEIIDEYPVYIAKEDNFMFVERMEGKLDISISALNISDNSGFYSTILPAINTDAETQEIVDIMAGEDGNKDEKTDEIPTMNGVVNTIGMNFLTSYEGLKDLSEYIRNYPEPTVIDNVSVSYDSSTGALAGSLTLKRYALSGSGKEYKSTAIEGINIGTDNIFGTDGKKNP